MAILYGEFYSNGALVLVILSVGQFINVCTGSAGMALSMTGNQKVLMYITTGCAVFMMVGGVLVAPYYGSTGVAVVTATAMTLANVLAVITVKKRRGIRSYANVKLITVKHMLLLLSLLRWRMAK